MEATEEEFNQCVDVINHILSRNVGKPLYIKNFKKIDTNQRGQTRQCFINFDHEDPTKTESRNPVYRHRIMLFQGRDSWKIQVFTPNKPIELVGEVIKNLESPESWYDRQYYFLNYPEMPYGIRSSFHRVNPKKEFTFTFRKVEDKIMPDLMVDCIEQISYFFKDIEL